jgi:hypothetical protein
MFLFIINDFIYLFSQWLVIYLIKWVCKFFDILFMIFYVKKLV